MKIEFTFSKSGKLFLDIYQKKIIVYGLILYSFSGLSIDDKRQSSKPLQREEMFN